MDSVLNSIKKLLGIEESYTHFDTDITMHINSVLMTLDQLGIERPTNRNVTSYTDTWTDIFGESPKVDVEALKTYVCLKVRLLFDPPTSAFVLESIDRQIKEYEWRLNVQAEK
jgi:hypothetical protein